VSIGVIVAGFAAISALLLWHCLASTKQVSEELLKEYERLLTDARENEKPQSDEESAAD
jgi:hypothetical protein